jgi:hypothetical protein
MTHPLVYSICLFMIVALLVSIIFVDRIKQSNKKHMIAGLYMLFAVFVHFLVLLLIELFQK